jgi:Protein of unknown function (DUF1684)
MGTTSLRTAPTPALVAGLECFRYSCNPCWSCPIPPQENRLKVAIRAGEKAFHAEGEGH